MRPPQLQRVPSSQSLPISFPNMNSGRRPFFVRTSAGWPSRMRWRLATSIPYETSVLSETMNWILYSLHM